MTESINNDRLQFAIPVDQGGMSIEALYEENKKLREEIAELRKRLDDTIAEFHAWEDLYFKQARRVGP